MSATGNRAAWQALPLQLTPVGSAGVCGLMACETCSRKDYNVDYAPRGATWFVLSGENDRVVFYEKVMFSCSGRVINSFALIYPIESKREFDPIVEGIERTFRPGQDCGRYATR